MPDYEPLPTAPESIWVGPADAELFFDQLGISWVGALVGFLNPRVVNIPTLCGSPPPATSEITSSDIASAFILGAPHDAAMAKLNSWVDRAVWDNNCIAVDVPPPDPVTPQPPPADLPYGPIPRSAAQSDMDQLLAWVKWIAQNITPRSYHGGGSTDVSGTGHWTIPYQSNSDWTVYAIGVEVTVTAKPEYAGRSNGGDFPVYYDLGWFTLDSGSMGQQPVRLQHEHQIETASVPKVTGFWYNLPPNVEIHVRALYPDTPGPLGEG